MDREKVINGLCEAIGIIHGYIPKRYWGYAEQACRDALELLKEQEPVAPVMVSHSRGIAWNCGECGTEIAVVRDTVSADAIPKMYLYCRMCGARIKWKVSV